MTDADAWVTRPERRKGEKSEVKQAQSRQLEVGFQGAPRLQVITILHGAGGGQK